MSSMITRDNEKKIHFFNDHFFFFMLKYCNQEFPRISLDHHEMVDCDERPTDCKYAVIGCQWKGPIHEATQHEAFCAHPKKSGADVMQSLIDRDAQNMEEKKRFNTLIDLLSYEKIIFNGKFHLADKLYS
jgi:hypothetical protein